MKNSSHSSIRNPQGSSVFLSGTPRRLLQWMLGLVAHFQVFWRSEDDHLVSLVMLTHLLSSSKPIAVLFSIRNGISCIEPEARPKCPAWRGYKIVVFKERLDNETAMFSGPTHGIYWKLDDPPEPLPPPALPYPHHSLTSYLEKCGSPFCHTL